MQTVRGGRLQERPRLSRRKRPNRVAPCPWRIHQCGHIASDQAPPQGVAERRPQRFPHVMDGPWGKSGCQLVVVELLDVLYNDKLAAGLVVVELLDVLRGKFGES